MPLPKNDDISNSPTNPLDPTSSGDAKAWRPPNFHDINDPVVRAYLSDPVNGQHGETIEQTHERLLAEDSKSIGNGRAAGGGGPN